MGKLRKSIVILVMSFVFFSLPSSVFAETMPSNEYISSQLEPTNEDFVRQNNESFRWVFASSGTPMGLSGESSPMIHYRLEVFGSANYTVNMYLNGQKVSATYDSSMNLLTYQSKNLSGKVDVSTEIEVYGQAYPLGSWSFTIDENPVKPFQNQNMTLLSTIQDESIARMNEYRASLGLPLFAANEQLQQAAQAHANYLFENNRTGHIESSKNKGFTGELPSARVSYFGYKGVVEEGITYHKRTGALGIDDLMDAPYHRLSIIHPKSILAGVGYNNRGDISINYGQPIGMAQNTDLVLYPNAGQKGAKVSWYVSENPNPLRFWNIDKEFVGYPISYAYFPKSSKEKLIVGDKSLKDSKGKEVPFYAVTPDIDSHGKYHVFIIPKKPLTPGETYDVSIQATVRDAKNNMRDLSRAWSFTTAAEIDIQDIYFVKEPAMNFLHVSYNSGEDKDTVLTLSRNSQTYIERKKGVQWLHRPIVAGDYTLEIDSPLFNTVQKMPVTLKENVEKRYTQGASSSQSGEFIQDGDWLVSFDKGASEPSEPSNPDDPNDPSNPSEPSTPTDPPTEELPPVEEVLTVEPITNESTEVVGKSIPGATVTLMMNNQVVETAVVSTEGLFTIPINPPDVGAKFELFMTGPDGEESDLLTVVVMDAIGLPSYESWTPTQTVKKNKEWIIRFNEQIDKKTVKSQNFYVQSNRKKVPGTFVSINKDGKSVTVHAPKTGYEEGKIYFLYIEDAVKSADGTVLNKPIKFKFHIE